MSQLSQAIAAESEKMLEAGHNDAAALLQVLATIVEGAPPIKAFGAPGEWGYGRPLGDGLLHHLRNPRGMEVIAVERREHLREHRFDAKRDAQYLKGELATAASCYAVTAALQAQHGELPPCFIPKDWPWPRESWKPSKSAIHNLAKSGSLAAAEIDRRFAAAKDGGAS